LGERENTSSYNRESHPIKYESRYIDTLVGTKLPEGESEYAERSPINHLDDLKAPMIIFQGSEAVPQFTLPLLYSGGTGDDTCHNP
jgi:hypothetical protein